MEHAFTCPQCGGHEFGTEGGLIPGKVSRGYCHGYVESKNGGTEMCTYQWDRARDAELHPRLLEGAGEISIAMEVRT